jgi:hypothetical protein
MKILIRFAKIFGIISAILLLLGATVYFIYNERLPEGEEGPEAEALAQKMLKAVHHEAFDSTRYIQWTFKGMHSFIWDKELNMVEVKWEDYEAVLDVDHPEKSTLKIQGQTITDDSKQELIEKAIWLFHNDAFWLIAPHKIMDPGTERRLVKLESGQEALLVTYTSGGTTPGDSYLWILNEEGLPISYKMWVKIIPIGGLEATWEKWTETETGVMLPGNHNIMGMDLEMTDLKTWNEN